MLEQKPQPVSEKFNLFHRYLLWFVKQKFCYSILRACKVYTDDHYQTATKNALPFIRNSELCMCYKILFWPAIFQRFLPSSALGPILRASHIAQEPTGSFPRPSFLAPWVVVVLYTTTTPTTRVSAAHILFNVYMLQMTSTVVGNEIDRFIESEIIAGDLSPRRRFVSQLRVFVVLWVTWETVDGTDKETRIAKLKWLGSLFGDVHVQALYQTAIRRFSRCSFLLTVVRLPECWITACSYWINLSCKEKDCGNLFFVFRGFGSIAKLNLRKNQFLRKYFRKNSFPYKTNQFFHFLVTRADRACNFSTQRS